MKCNVCRDGSMTRQNRNGSWLDPCPACGWVYDPQGVDLSLSDLKADIDLQLQSISELRQRDEVAAAADVYRKIGSRRCRKQD